MSEVREDLGYSGWKRPVAMPEKTIRIRLLTGVAKGMAYVYRADVAEELIRAGKAERV